MAIGKHAQNRPISIGAQSTRTNPIGIRVYKQFPSDEEQGREPNELIEIIQILLVIQTRNETRHDTVDG